MRPDLHQCYTEFLNVAAEAVRRRDKRAAMYCLSQALRAANAAEASPRYRAAVMRAMNYVRRIDSALEA